MMFYVKKKIRYDFTWERENENVLSGLLMVAIFRDRILQLFSALYNFMLFFSAFTYEYVLLLEI